MIALMLVAVPAALAPVASAAPDCYEIYRETQVGPVIVVQRSSCHAEICWESTDNCGLLQ